MSRFGALNHAKHLLLRGKHEELRSELSSNPRLLTERDGEGLTLLHHAAIKNKLECLEVLLDNGGRQIFISRSFRITWLLLIFDFQAMQTCGLLMIWCVRNFFHFL